MESNSKLEALVKKFEDSLDLYKDPNIAYNEHSCRIEYIDPFLEILGWDVANKKANAPQSREVIAENYSTKTDRPDYSLTLRGVTKFFVEAKKPSVDIDTNPGPAFQTRRYGWNAKHKIAVLTNFEYLVIYDTTCIPKDTDNTSVARHRRYHYLEYVSKLDEIKSLISRDFIYEGDFDQYYSDELLSTRSQKQQVDDLFLSQINKWRVSLSNELYLKDEKYRSLEKLNDVVQEFINQIVFLRICEDKNLPLYHKLSETIDDSESLHNELEQLFRRADRKYNSGIFAREFIIFDLSSDTISDMIKELYYPQSPYLFNIIEPNLLGKIYEIFLTEQLFILEDDTIGLGKKKDFANRSIVTTPIEIVKYMVEKSLERVCDGKTPDQLLDLRIADIACGSGIYLEEVFDYLETYCVNWYLKNDKTHLEEIGNGRYKLPFLEKKNLLCSCIYGIDIDIHAVEVAKFSLLIKLIENENEPSVANIDPILPTLEDNIFYGNALISEDDVENLNLTDEKLFELAPFNWSDISNVDKFDVIIGNPPYVKTDEMLHLLQKEEIQIYKNKFTVSQKQFDKYFVFIEQAITKVKENGYICFIVPNKFFKIASGKKLRELIASKKLLTHLDDFGDAQLFEDKTIYSSIILLQNKEQDEFTYSGIESASKLWIGEHIDSITMGSSMLDDSPWRLTTDFDLLNLLSHLDTHSVPLQTHAEIFNGIQTSAERPKPIYWFSKDEIESEDQNTYTIKRDNHLYSIEKDILKPYFKPTKKAERGLNSYSILDTDKLIIFPYDNHGKLIPIDVMKKKYQGTYQYLKANYDRLVPKSVSESGKRDVPGAIADTWYQYGRTQALTSFTNTDKLIVGVLSQDPMYAFDSEDMLISSGGTAGYCAIAKKQESPYSLEYIQAWLSSPITERIIRVVGSDFEGGFVSRGTYLLSRLPFVELNFENPAQRDIYDNVVELTQEVYETNRKLKNNLTKSEETLLLKKKKKNITSIEKLIEEVYNI